MIYFDLPGVEQDFPGISRRRFQHDLPRYSGVWDGEKNSTLRKLEVAITPLMNPVAVVGQAA